MIANVCHSFVFTLWAASFDLEHHMNISITIKTKNQDVSLPHLHLLSFSFSILRITCACTGYSSKKRWASSGSTPHHTRWRGKKCLWRKFADIQEFGAVLRMSHQSHAKLHFLQLFRIPYAYKVDHLWYISDTSDTSIRRDSVGYRMFR